MDDVRKFLVFFIPYGSLHIACYETDDKEIASEMGHFIVQAPWTSRKITVKEFLDEAAVGDHVYVPIYEPESGNRERYIVRKA